MIVIGIDPGEAWCGIAALNIKKRSVVAEARTLAIKPRTPISIVRAALPFSKKDEVIVIAENYNFRPVGHQRFSTGQTVRLLGALEFYTRDMNWKWHLIPPGPWQKEIPLIFGNNLLAEYRRHWPQPRHQNWDHCMSAWRVLGRYLLTEQLTSVLAPLRKKHGIGDDAYWHPADSFMPVRSTRKADLIAPAVLRLL